MTFMNQMKSTALNSAINHSVTENGALGFTSTGKALVDLNYKTSSLRGANDTKIIDLFMKAYFEDRDLALKWLFFARDIRGGMGERRLFRVIFKHLAKMRNEEVKHLLKYVVEYGRYDDLVELLDTPLENEVINIFVAQLQKDIEAFKHNQSISLLAKWLPSANASSNTTRRHAKKIVKQIGLTEREYRKTLSKLRAYSNIIEVKMSAKEWDKIDYSHVPSRANLIYNGAFLRNDENRRREFLGALVKGEVKINAGTLYPYELVNKYLNFTHRYSSTPSGTNTYDETIEQLWKALPRESSLGRTLIVSDGSGSMFSNRIPKTNIPCWSVATALAIYFAEGLAHPFKNQYITFSEKPEFVDLNGCRSLQDKVEEAMHYTKAENTNIEAVFDLVLETAVRNNLSKDELPDRIVIASDMEFDHSTCDTQSTLKKKGWYSSCTGFRSTLFEEIAQRFAAYGYKLPKLVFWNIYSRTETIPVIENEYGVALVSGFSPNIQKMIMSNKLDPYEILKETLLSERYSVIKAV